MKLKTPANQPSLFVGIDWADQKHVAWWITDDQSSRQHESFDQDPKAIAQWVQSLHQRFPGHQVKIALEQARGALFIGLASFQELKLYPINPKQLARYRESIYPSGGKSDPSDARLLAEFLQQMHPRLRSWRPDDTSTRRIAELTELRRKLVEQRKRLVLQLNGCLKLYFPQILTLTSRDLHHDLVLNLLRRWPTLKQLQRAHPKTIRTFLAEQGMNNEDQQTKIIEAVRSARPLTTDPAVIDPQARYAQTLVQQIRDLNQAIAGFDKELQTRVAKHADHQTFRSLPGAGDALIPRLIAAFGSDRDRYQNARQLQCYSGIAPLTWQTGNSLHVRKRSACPKFLRQTFHEFADQARRWSDWSRAYYDMKKSQGMKHNAAVRSLAYKWIRILFRLWKERTTYSEADYLARLKQTNSPILQFIKS